MSLNRVLGIFAFILFGCIATAALFKGKKEPTAQSTAVELPATGEVRVINEQEESTSPQLAVSKQTATPKKNQQEPIQKVARALPQIDRVGEFFNRGVPQVPIVQTITYSSRVPWLKGRPAWLSDYASHYKTSRHFIARSLNGRPDYLKQELAEGDRFNILRSDKNFHFHLVVDVHNCKMLFYYIDDDNNDRQLIKTYNVGLGRLDPSSASGFLTPLGKYQLGDRTAVYRPKMKGFHNGERVELISVFGTRWIPFDCEVADCTAPAKGFGVHGVPWTADPATGKLVENTEGIGKHMSDGCIRLATADVEELFSIIISRPTTVELVRNWEDSAISGDEQAAENSGSQSPRNRRG